jgi:hypothetical protein
MVSSTVRLLAKESQKSSPFARKGGRGVLDDFESVTRSHSDFHLSSPCYGFKPSVRLLKVWSRPVSSPSVSLISSTRPGIRKNDLECALFGRISKRVIRLHDVVHREAMSHQLAWLQLA